MIPQQLGPTQAWLATVCDVAEKRQTASGPLSNNARVVEQVRLEPFERFSGEIHYVEI